MDKEYAIEFIKENNTVTLIERLISDGDECTAMNIIQNCWGYTDDEVIDFIEEEWNF